MQFDDFYTNLGSFGRYQKTKYFLICLTYMLPPIMVYTWSFTAAKPNFRCRTPMDNALGVSPTDDGIRRYAPSESQCRQYHSKISVAECQKCYQLTNESDYDTSQMKPCTSFIFDRTYYQSTLVEEWYMVCGRVSLRSYVQTVFFFGYMVGSLVFGVLSDKFGRRPIMGVSFIVITLASLMCALVPHPKLGFEISYSVFVLGRFLLACGTRGVALTGFVIGSEIVGPKQRLFTGIVIEYFFAGGELVLLGFAYFMRSWRQLNTTLAMFSIPFLFFYFVLPESPRWLLSKGHYEHAERILRRIAKTNDTQFDSIAYEHLILAEKKREALHPKKVHGLKHLLQSKIMIIIAINMSFQWFVQNLVFYGVSQNTGEWLPNPYISFFAGALIEIAAYCVVHLVLDRFGRKLTYCGFVLFFGIVAFLVLPIQMFITTDSRVQRTLMFILNVALKFLASGSYAIIYIYANELFPTQARNTGMGICSMFARFGAIIATFSNDLLVRAWIHFPIIVYGTTSLIAVAFATICPETANRPLPQTIYDIDRMGLTLPCRKSRPLACDDMNGMTDSDEDIALKHQLNGNDIF
ncbi:unnamed protein product [Rotaria socialis]|uniref:Major facilitator superfamily (MFS) profile domain-containing protein n=1 Tax=Rotaria socialis TaxID=392032 RepID=A0A820UU70_9BILA|nr:unnamed protein product [Rotaria socialis]CAF3304366.1 unnamed protein product [Rotaria socialis]CAF3311565.1 unnamed protein product [Rotaria socialis]CAF3325033.1 unnamed protein product [Rotaria socialis]CAF4214274.1 unnamed protein product [Rotaria socialis]